MAKYFGDIAKGVKGVSLLPRTHHAPNLDSRRLPPASPPPLSVASGLSESSHA